VPHPERAKPVQGGSEFEGAEGGVVANGPARKNGEALAGEVGGDGIENGA